MKTLWFLTVAVFFLFVCSFGYAKPMPAPTKEEAYKSQVIVIAEYLGYKSHGKIDYFRGPIAQYKTIRVLKGDAPASLNVRHDFSDGSACIAEVGWKFTDNLMPKKGSKWILFLKNDNFAKEWTTYRGDFGRWKAKLENIKEVESSLSKK